MVLHRTALLLLVLIQTAQSAEVCELSEEASLVQKNVEVRVKTHAAESFLPGLSSSVSEAVETELGPVSSGSADEEGDGGMMMPQRPNILQMMKEEESCECLNWKETYASGLVVYGAANEKFEAQKGLDGDARRQESFQKSMKDTNDYDIEQGGGNTIHTKLDNNACFSIDTDSDLPANQFNYQTWCYVSKDCRRLNGGRQLTDSMAKSYTLGQRSLYDKNEDPDPPPGNITVGWKVCTEKDERLRDYGFAELWALAKESGISPSKLIFNSYVRKERSTSNALSTIKFRKRRQVEKLGTPIIFDLVPEHLWSVADGKLVWMFNEDEFFCKSSSTLCKGYPTDENAPEE